MIPIVAFVLMGANLMCAHPISVSSDITNNKKEP